MFYSPAILAKKGDLSHVWVAAHWHNKLTKQQVQNLDIAQSIKAIKQPTLPLSLRLSGQLLHGVARIHQKKVAYLFTDCNDALVKIKMAFRPGALSAQNLNVSEHNTTTSVSTPHRINAPALDDDDEEDDEEEEVIPKSSSSSSRRFKNVEIQVDEDDWTKMTPVHMRKSISRRTPSIDLDYAAAAVAAGDGAQTPTGAAGESWSEFPFASEEPPSSIEVVRRANDSNIRLSTMSAPEQQQQQQEADYVPPDDMIFGDEFHAAAPQHPETPGAGDAAGADLQGLLLQSGSKLKSSWLQDVERRESEVTEETMRKRAKQTPEKPTEAGDEAPKTVARSKRAQQIELSNDFIQNALHDTSDICQPKRRNSVRDRIRAERTLEQQFGFLPPSSVSAPTFEESSLPLHSSLAQKFVDHAKPVPKLTADEVEVARDLEEQSRIEDQQQQQNPPYHQEELDVPMDAPPTFGDEYQGESFTAAAKHELEETFVEDKKENEEEELFVSSSQQQQGEEERWNPQTIKMMKLLREKLSVQPVIAYQDLAVQQRKTVVAKAFFEVLQLTTRGMVHVSQEEPFGEILISPGQKYDTLLPTE